jgi:hypothetical protein
MKSPNSSQDFNKTRAKTTRLAALRRLSAQQDRAAAAGRPFTLSRAELARELRFSRAQMEAIDLLCRLRLLQGLARRRPEVLAELGVQPHQIHFLCAMRPSAGQARRLWRRWRHLAGKEQAAWPQSQGCCTSTR